MNGTRLDEEFTSAVHVYEPHRAGLPRMKPYFQALFRRREFAAELSRASMRSANTTTVLGQLWLVLNPLLLGCVYFLLVFIIRGRADANFFAHLIAGLFAYYYFSGALQTGASSVVGGGKLLLNTSFPRMLLPLSAVRTAFFRFLPTLIVYLGVHVFTGQTFAWQMLLSLYFIVMLTIFAAGAAMFFATAQVYFRDTASFLPYIIRIWLYLSPVLWVPAEGVARLEGAFGDVGWLMLLNPHFSMIGGWSEALVRGQVPELSMWIGSLCWAFAALIVGGLFFMSREREFAVRL